MGFGVRAVKGMHVHRQRHLGRQVTGTGMEFFKFKILTLILLKKEKSSENYS